MENSANYILLSVNEDGVVYIASNTLRKITEQQNILDGLIDRKLVRIRLNEDDNPVTLRENTIELNDRFGYLKNEISGNRLKDEYLENQIEDTAEEEIEEEEEVNLDEPEYSEENQEESFEYLEDKVKDFEDSGEDLEIGLDDIPS